MTVLNAGNSAPKLEWSHEGEEAYHATASVLSDREYGTFEVSIIDMEEADGSRSRKLSHDSAPSSCASCASDCGLLLRILLSPVRLDTYKCVAFHVANFVFAVLAAAWMLLLITAKALVGWDASWSAKLRRVESDALRGLLRVDCRLFNFIAADKDCVTVHNSPLGFQQEAGFFGVYAQAYFLGVKLLCAGIPGVLFAAMFVWAWLHVALLTMRAGFGVHFDAADDKSHALSHAHTLELEASAAVMALYGCVLLLQVVAFVSRSITMFFCAEFLVYSP